MPITDPNGVAQSKAWCDYFLANQPRTEDFPWDDAYVLAADEKRAITHSIQQFQLGERAEGKRLLNGGRAFGSAVGDPHFATALALFIKEEQRHSAHLLRFMNRQGIPAVTTHWVDSSFRRLRNLAGLEISLRTLVTAEIIAIPYYRALRGATRSRLLQSICARILQDEAGHLRFQSSMLSRLSVGRRWIVQRVVWGLHRLFLIDTCCVVWMEHRAVFARAGYSFGRLLAEALAEFAVLEWPACRVRTEAVLGSYLRS